MKKKNLLLTAVTILLIVFDSTIFAQYTDIYVVGNPNGDAVVWKNSEIIFKPEVFRSRARKICVSNGDMYVLGYIDIGGTGNEDTRVVVWKNGEIIYTLTDSLGSSVCSMFVSGRDVYVTCTEGNYYNWPPKGIAKVWKNGVLLFTISNEVGIVLPYSVIVVNGDVYVAGTTENCVGGIVERTAKVWKNGKEFYILTEGARKLGAYSMFIANNDIYVAGKDGMNAQVWKNGEVLYILTDGTKEGAANSIYISNGDIYVTGMDGYTAKVWKNGEFLYSLFWGSYLRTSSIFIFENDVYVSGSDNKGIYYWKNGERITLHEGLVGGGDDIIVVDSTVGISETPNSEITIYPNPTNSKLNIEIESHITLYNLQGILLKETYGKEIDISEYPHGIYFLRVEGKTVKVVKN